MGDFSFLDSAPPVQRKPAGSRQQQGAGTAAAAAAAAAAAGGSAGCQDGAAPPGGQQQQQQQQAPRVRIQLPSFRQVQAAEAAASKPINSFVPGRLGSQQQQQQQQSVAPPPAAAFNPLGSGAAAAGPSSNRLSGAAAAAAAVAAAGTTMAPPPTAAGTAGAPWQQQQQQQLQQQPSWAASLPSLSLNTALPRFSQTASGATTGAAVGIARGPALHAAAGASAAAGGGGGLQGAGLQQAAAAAGGGGVGAATGSQQQQQQQQVPINAVLVSRRQQGNPVLKHIRSVRWVFADIVPDYLCGQNTAVLFLSLRYHLLQPEYILARLQSLQRSYRLAVLLLLVDAEEVVKPLQELHRATLGSQAVLVCAWSNEECARYIETFKAFENRPASSIMEHTDTDYMGRLASAVTTIRGVNRSDAYSLARHFGSLADAFRCKDVQGFASIPGLGPVKAKRLLDTFNQPFKRSLTAMAAGTSHGASQLQGRPLQEASQQQSAGQQPQPHPQAAVAGSTQGVEQDDDNIGFEEGLDADEGTGIADEDAEEVEAAAGGAGGDAGVDFEGGDQQGETEVLDDALGGYHEDFLEGLDDGLDGEEF